MIKTEAQYQKAVMLHLKKFPGWYYKIPDTNMQIKPFDIIGFASEHGVMYPTAIELKICNLKKGLTYEQAYKMLRPNQVGALASFQKSGGTSRVWVYNKAEQTDYKFAFKYLENVATGSL